VSKGGVLVPPHQSQPNPAPRLNSALTEPQPPQQANSCSNHMPNYTCLQRRAGGRARGGCSGYGQCCGGECVGKFL